MDVILVYGITSLGDNRTIRGITRIKHAHLGDRGDGIREAFDAQDHLVLPRDALGGVFGGRGAVLVALLGIAPVTQACWLCRDVSDRDEDRKAEQGKTFMAGFVREVTSDGGWTPRAFRKHDRLEARKSRETFCQLTVTVTSN
jgi:hypothetical protein